MNRLPCTHITPVQDTNHTLGSHVANKLLTCRRLILERCLGNFYVNSCGHLVQSLKYKKTQIFDKGHKTRMVFYIFIHGTLKSMFPIFTTNPFFFKTKPLKHPSFQSSHPHQLLEPNIPNLPSVAFIYSSIDCEMQMLSALCGL